MSKEKYTQETIEEIKKEIEAKVKEYNDKISVTSAKNDVNKKAYEAAIIARDAAVAKLEILNFAVDTTKSVSNADFDREDSLDTVKKGLAEKFKNPFAEINNAKDALEKANKEVQAAKNAFDAEGIGQANPSTINNLRTDLDNKTSIANEKDVNLKKVEAAYASSKDLFAKIQSNIFNYAGKIAQNKAQIKANSDNLAQLKQVLSKITNTEARAAQQEQIQEAEEKLNKSKADADKYINAGIKMVSNHAVKGAEEANKAEATLNKYGNEKNGIYTLSRAKLQHLQRLVKEAEKTTTNLNSQDADEVQAAAEKWFSERDNAIVKQTASRAVSSAFSKISNTGKIAGVIGGLLGLAYGVSIAAAAAPLALTALAGAGIFVAGNMVREKFFPGQNTVVETNNSPSVATKSKLPAKLAEHGVEHISNKHVARLGSETKSTSKGK